jgi:hypothetical protein
MLCQQPTGLWLTASQTWEIKNGGPETGPRKRHLSADSFRHFMLCAKLIPANCPEVRKKILHFAHPLQSKDWLAGAEGIEPSNAGIKIQCLTTWRRPSRAGAGPGADPYKASEGGPQTAKMTGLTGGWRPVAGAGGHRYKGASRGEGVSPRTGSESSSAW